jgi:hypothetical protein
MKNNTNTPQESVSEAMAVPASHLSHDLKNSVLIISVVVNLVIFTGWIILQMTSQYDASLASFLLGR